LRTDILDDERGPSMTLAIAPGTHKAMPGFGTDTAVMQESKHEIYFAISD
jgi:hypothetical protein